LSAYSKMNRKESTYLDLVRSIAALDVVFGHACDFYNLPFTGRWGHQAIMVFFVLSGYVIAYVADTRENNLQMFLVARLARLWSVLVPALILTVICDFLGRHFGVDSRGFAESPTDHFIIRIGAMLVFFSETWVSIQPLSNGAAWSLCLEFWYYVTFALWTFMRPGWLRIGMAFFASLLSGHKGLLLLPVWLMGVMLQRNPGLRRHSAPLDGALWLISLLLIGWIMIGRVYDPAIEWMKSETAPWLFEQLAQSRVFWLDWLLGLLVAVHLLAARRVSQWLPLELIATPAHWCAGVSFAIYLFHYPLLHLSAAFLPVNQGWLAIGITLAIIALLGPPAERSKTLWRGWLNKLVSLATKSVQENPQKT
jgi:peptidoglycan/LPS O-acetylase OafA/YrhL